MTDEKYLKKNEIKYKVKQSIEIKNSMERIK